MRAGGYPFGEPSIALHKSPATLAILAKTHYGEGGYYGYAEIGEERNTASGALDVVPRKTGDWDYGPFDPIEKDGMLWPWHTG
jgi:acetylornithine deacetylase/succinyl-diaminopimelate desuccinylase-like protein